MKRIADCPTCGHRMKAIDNDCWVCEDHGGFTLEYLSEHHPDCLGSYVGTGIRQDAGKPRTDLLPVDSLLAVAEVMRWGCEDKPKPYDERNWERGMEWHKLYAPVLRHLWAWWQGETADPESGLHPLDHALTSMMMLHASVRRGIGTDDRPVRKDNQKPYFVDSETWKALTKESK